MAKPVGKKERARIVAMLRDEGKSQNATAKAVGRNVSTISRIARTEGIESNVAATKKATAARKDYAQAERLELLNEGFEKARSLLSAEAFGTSALKDWSVAVGTLIDKRRLEDGEATNRTENVDPAARKRVRDGLDELARFRSRMAGRS